MTKSERLAEVADRQLFVLSDDAWTELTATLDRPASRHPQLDTLFDAPSIFE